jgi:hypothetical protein
MALRLSALRVGRSIPPGEFLALVSVRGLVDPRAIVRLELSGQLKTPVASSRVEPMTFRLVAEFRSQLCYLVPQVGRKYYGIIMGRSHVSARLSAIIVHSVDVFPLSLIGARYYRKYRPMLGPTQPPVQWVPAAISPGVKRQGRESDHSSPTSTGIKKTWIITTTAPYFFIA